MTDDDATAALAAAYRTADKPIMHPGETPYDAQARVIIAALAADGWRITDKTALGEYLDYIDPPEGGRTTSAPEPDGLPQVGGGVDTTADDPASAQAAPDPIAEFVHGVYDRSEDAEHDRAIERAAVRAALKGLREEVADCPRDDEGGIWLEDVYALIDARLAALDA